MAHRRADWPKSRRLENCENITTPPPPYACRSLIVVILCATEGNSSLRPVHRRRPFCVTAAAALSAPQAAAHYLLLTLLFTSPYCARIASFILVIVDCKRGNATFTANLHLSHHAPLSRVRWQPATIQTNAPAQLLLLLSFPFDRTRPAKKKDTNDKTADGPRISVNPCARMRTCTLPSYWLRPPNKPVLAAAVAARRQRHRPCSHISGLSKPARQTAFFASRPTTIQIDACRTCAL